MIAVDCGRAHSREAQYLAVLGWQLRLKTYGRSAEKEKLHAKLMSLMMDGKGGSVVITAQATP